MPDTMLLDAIVNGLLALLRIGVLLGLAGVSLWRLGRSAAGLLLTGTFAAWAFKVLLIALAQPLIFRFAGDPLPFVMGRLVISTSLQVVFLGTLAAGLLLIPGALRRREP